MYEKIMAELPVLAKQILVGNTVKAAQILVSGLDSSSEHVQQESAKRILDRVLSGNPLEGKTKVPFEEWMESQSISM